MTTCNPIALAEALIRCPSVTPADEGALATLEAALEPLGFACERMPFEAPGTARVDNLYARLGTEGPNLCFAGHTDVVPVGDADAWTIPPFDARIEAGRLFGRGAADMKGAIACFVAAVARVTGDGPLPGSVSLLITGDEEGPSVNGTKPMLETLVERGETIDQCLVGEPTNPTRLGDMIKIGRRGSINGWLTVRGAQGHVAYPHLADNPLPKLIKLVDRLAALPLDEGTEHFQPSNLEITNIQVGNTATNVIPASGTATFNIRFNDCHTGASLEAAIRELLDAAAAEIGTDYELTTATSGEAFLTPPNPFTDIVARAVEEVTGRRPELSTSGGTSDARFICHYAPVLEFGLIGETMHKVDENVLVTDIEQLTDIYTLILKRYFGLTE